MQSILHTSLFKHERCSLIISQSQVIPVICSTVCMIQHRTTKKKRFLFIRVNTFEWLLVHVTSFDIDMSINFFLLLMPDFIIHTNASTISLWRNWLMYTIELWSRDRYLVAIIAVYNMRKLDMFFFRGIARDTFHSNVSNGNFPFHVTVIGPSTVFCSAQAFFFRAFYWTPISLSIKTHDA